MAGIDGQAIPDGFPAGGLLPGKTGGFDFCTAVQIGHLRRTDGQSAAVQRGQEFIGGEDLCTDVSHVQQIGPLDLLCIGGTAVRQDHHFVVQ